MMYYKEARHRENVNSKLGESCIPLQTENTSSQQDDIQQDTEGKYHLNRAMESLEEHSREEKASKTFLLHSEGKFANIVTTENGRAETQDSLDDGV